MTRLAGVFEASVAIISAEPSDDDHTFAIMTPRQIALVQSSWEKVVPISAEAAALFYRRLFELDPSLRALFTTDITEQGKKLMAMLSVVVRGLTRLEEIVPAVKAMGRRHLSYGVKDEATRRWAPRCFGLWGKGWERPSTRKHGRPGPLRTGCFRSRCKKPHDNRPSAQPLVRFS